jgi:hypothetical protein
MNEIDFSQIPLRDIHLPDPVGWWPPAPGWWLVAALVIGGLVVAWLRYHRRFRERAALKALKRVLAALEQGAEPVSCLQQISMVMRRFAMSVAATERPVAGLTGERWLDFLDSRWDRHTFSRGIGRTLIVGPYARPDRVVYGDVREVAGVCVEWIAAQRPGR